MRTRKLRRNQRRQAWVCTRAALACLAVAGACLALVGPALTGAAEAAEQETLAERLGRILHARGQGRTDLGTLEKRALELLREFPSPQDKGIIYAAIADMYYQTDYEAYGAEIVLFAKKALQYPLSLDKEVRTRRCWASALRGQMTDAKGEVAHPEKRREAALLLLGGLKLVLEHLTEDRLQRWPVLPRLTIDGPLTPEDRKRYEEHRRREKERQRIIQQNELLRTRDLLCQQVSQLYIRKPYNLAELKRLLAATIGDGRIAQEILQDVRARNEGRQGVQWMSRLKMPPPPPGIPVPPEIRARIDQMKRETAARPEAGKK